MKRVILLIMVWCMFPSLGLAADNAACQLVDAARNKDLATLKTLLDLGHHPNANCGNKTPLIAASFSGHAEVVKILLDRGADPNIQDTGGETALMQAVARVGHGQEQIVRMLLAAGADINIRDKRGETVKDRLLKGPMMTEKRKILELLNSASNKSGAGTR